MLAGTRLTFTGNAGVTAGIYHSDGTIAGTKQIIDTSGIAASVESRVPPIAIGDALVALDGKSPFGAYRIDNVGDTAQYIAVGVIPNQFLVAFGSKALTLSRADDFDNFEPWLVDPAALSAHQIGDFYKGTRGSQGGTFYRSGGRVWFSTFPRNNTEIWATDLDGTHPHLITTFTGNTSATSFVPFGAEGNVAFVNYSSGVRQVWTSDGTAAGTAVIATALPSSNALLSNGSALFFVANDVAHGTELWTSDGTSAGTHILFDATPGTGNSAVELIRADGAKVVFAAGPDYLQLYRTDGTTVTTVTPANVVLRQGDTDLAYLGGKYYFTGLDRTKLTDRMYVTNSDVTTATVVPLTVSSTTFVSQYSPIATNDSVYFPASTDAQGLELWQVTDAGASLVRDINPGSASSKITLLGTAGNHVFFLATDASNVQQLWTSDGTESGTLSPHAFVNADSRGTAMYLGSNGPLAYFFANDPLYGYELWQSDGTVAGTTIVQNVATGTASTSVRGKLAAYDDHIIVNLNDGYHGDEPWITSDNRAPAVASIVYDRETARRVTITFDEVIDPQLDATKITLVRSTDGLKITPTSITRAINGRSLTIQLPASLPAGDFLFTFGAGAARDVSANALTTPSTLRFANLPGDINGDRLVNFDDLIILAQNYNRTGKTYSQGNIDYSADGSVNFDDLVILAQHYNVSLVVPPPMMVAAVTPDHEPAKKTPVACGVVG